VNYEEEIKKLIGDVDSAKNDFMDYLRRGIPDILLLSLIMLVILLVQVFGIQKGEEIYVQWLIASGAFIISLIILYDKIYPKWDKTYAEYKAKKMCRSLNYDKKETQVLLTALIVMKNKQPKTELSTVYKLEPTIFAKDKLIQLLYEFC